MRLAPLNRFKPSSKSIFTDRSKAVLLLWILYLVMLYVGVCCNVVFVLSLVVICWEMADLLAVVCVVFCHSPKCVLAHIRIKGEVGAVKLV